MERRIDKEIVVKQIDENNRLILKISTYHSKGHKAYYLSISRGVLGRNFFKYAPMEDSEVFVCERDVKRYSAKRLEELHLENCERFSANFTVWEDWAKEMNYERLVE